MIVLELGGPARGSGRADARADEAIETCPTEHRRARSVAGKVASPHINTACLRGIRACRDVGEGASNGAARRYPQGKIACQEGRYEQRLARRSVNAAGNQILQQNCPLAMSDDDDSSALVVILQVVVPSGLDIGHSKIGLCTG